MRMKYGCAMGGLALRMMPLWLVAGVWFQGSLSAGKAQVTDSSEVPLWKQYARLGFVHDEGLQGVSGYYRLNRRTELTFRDLRLFTYALGKDSYVFLRYKSSNKYRRLSWLYNFTTLFYQRNTRANVSLRYHFNQGLGAFVHQSATGHITVELGQAYDMSNYLDSDRKTSYLKTGLYWDQDLSRLSTKWEAEYFYQISEVVEANLSRTQLQGELLYSLGRGFSVIVGYELEYYSSRRRPESWYVELGWKQPLQWSL